MIKEHHDISTEKQYTAQDIANLFNLSPVTVRQYTSLGKIHASISSDEGVRYTEADVEAFRAARADWNANTQGREKSQTGKSKKPSPQELPHVHETVLPPTPVSPPEGINEALLLQDVIAQVFTFLAAHQLPTSIQSFREIPASVRMWEITVAGGQEVRVIVEHEQVTILSDAYLHALEESNAHLKKQMHDTEMTLALLRKKRENRTLTEYAEPLTVQIEPCQEGVLITCQAFPIASREKTEEEAIAAFRRLLWGYTAWLSKHLATLSTPLRAQFEQLRALLLENEE